MWSRRSNHNISISITVGHCFLFIFSLIASLLVRRTVAGAAVTSPEKSYGEVKDLEKIRIQWRV
ncbi:hypothetical protein Hanom_Chr05g00404521 [Helianthus anomalus]